MADDRWNSQCAALADVREELYRMLYEAHREAGRRMLVSAPVRGARRLTIGVTITVLILLSVPLLIYDQVFLP
jgi:hypothetical protein